ncbi:hypothetical protein B0H19DRAFT_1076997 [Mycena capillaripes]|nr:hypothetical protein B0H19DRAFT_1076997 [Mycena capillaripes]
MPLLEPEPGGQLTGIWPPLVGDISDRKISRLGSDWERENPTEPDSTLTCISVNSDDDKMILKEERPNQVTESKEWDQKTTRVHRTPEQVQVQQEQQSYIANPHGLYGFVLRVHRARDRRERQTDMFALYRSTFWGKISYDHKKIPWSQSATAQRKRRNSKNRRNIYMELQTPTAGKKTRSGLPKSRRRQFQAQADIYSQMGGTKHGSTVVNDPWRPPLTVRAKL